MNVNEQPEHLDQLEIILPQSPNALVDMLRKNLDSGQVIRAFSTTNLSTHFVIQNALAAYVAPLSYYPEDEVLFPLMSRFLIREVERNFPRNPDKVTLVYPEGRCPTPPLESRRSSLVRLVSSL